MIQTTFWVIDHFNHQVCPFWFVPSDNTVHIEPCHILHTISPQISRTKTNKNLIKQPLEITWRPSFNPKMC